MAERGLTDADLKQVLVGDLEPFTATLVEHNPRWQHVAAQWCDRLLTAVPKGATVEHVGSTSVPDLKAKPVIDLLATVTDPDAPDLEARLAPLGLQPRWRSPGRRTLRTADHRVQLHVLRYGDPQAVEIVRLRDVLRADAHARRRYEAEKVQTRPTVMAGHALLLGGQRAGHPCPTRLAMTDGAPKP